jgi:hypothetical protein
MEAFDQRDRDFGRVATTRTLGSNVENWAPKEVDPKFIPSLSGRSPVRSFALIGNNLCAEKPIRNEKRGSVRE